jgi:metal-sulfur cluster biosynthetic enzyme
MNDPQILAALKEVLDPELGINIVDLGLIYRADWTPVGIEVAMALTAPTCPAGELLVEQAGSALRRHFPETRNIRVDLLMDKQWSPERLSDDGRRALGWLRTTTDSLGAVEAIMPVVSTRWKH